MAFTKVVGPGIHTLSNIASHNINSSGIITATQFDGPFSNVVVGGATTLTVDGINISAGILTAKTLDLNGNGDISGNLVVGGNLTANGDLTTLNTTLREVELLRVDADSSATAGIITQRGSGDILNLYDGSTEVFSVADGGNVDVKTGNVTLEEGRLFVKRTTIPSVDVRNSTNTSYSRVILQQGAAEGGYFQISREGTNSTAGAGANSVELNQSSNHPLTIKTNNTERLRIKGTGEVGIGTDNPDELLHLESTASTVKAKIESTATNSYPTLRLKNDAREYDLQVNGATDAFRVYDVTATTERLTITSSGDVGIQTSSPATIFHVYGSSGTTPLFLLESATYKSYIGTIQSANNLNNGSLAGDLALRGQSAISFSANNGTATQVRITSTGVSFGDLNLTNIGTIACDSLKGDADDNTNITFAGSDVITFKAGTTSPALTINTTQVKVEDGHYIVAGSGNDFKIHHDNAGSASDTIDSGSGYLYINSDALRLNSKTSAWNYLRGDKSDGVVKLYKSNSERLATSEAGITVTGEVAATQDYPLVKPILNWNFAATKTLDPRIQFRRTGTGTFIDEKGIVQYAGNNKPRFDHHPTTGASLGLLLEKSSTNYQPYSVDMSQGANNNEVTVENNAAIAPDGTMSASKITGGTNQSTSQRLGWNTASVANGSYTNWSIWLKSEETSCLIQIYSNTYTIGAAHITIELADGTTTGSTSPSSTVRYNVEKYPNKWWRVSWSGNGAGAAGGMYVSVVPTTGSARAANTGAAHSKVWYAWGLQEEISTDRKFTTSYIPTYGVSVARGHDNAEVLGDDFDDFFDLYQGTVVHEFSNAFQTWTYGGSGWEFNNDNYQYNVITQISSGYAHNSYPGAYAVANGENSDSGTNSSSLFGSSSSPGNAPTNGGYDAGRVPNSTTVDNTRYYKTYTDAFSWDVSGSTNHLRVSSGGFGATNTNTNNISFRNISKLVFGNEASDMDGSYQKFNGRIKNWMYYDKALPVSQLNTMTAQHPQTYL